MTTNSAFDLIGLNDLRNDPRYRLIDGQVDNGPQLAIAILDTGLYGSHPELDNNFLAYGDFVDNSTGRAVSAEDIVFATDPGASRDTNGHGTHVAGTIGAEDDSIGVAPSVKLIGLDVLGGPFTQNTTITDIQSAVLNGLEWVKDNRQGTFDGQEYRIVGINMSLGFYGKANSIENAPFALQGIFSDPAQLDSRAASSPEVRARNLTQELETAGISVVSATGNDYANHAELRRLNQTMPDGATIPVKNVSTPAISSTIAAGSLDARGGRISPFSQRLDFGSMLHAPGGDIRSTISPEGDTNGDGTEILSGTSMASPHIAGAIALMQDAALTYGGRILSPTEIQDILIETADVINDGDDENYTGPVESTGEDFLRMNIYSAIQEIDRRFGGNEQPTPEPDPDPDPEEPNPEPEPAPGGDPNGTIATALSLEEDLGFTLDSLAEFSIVGTEVIGTDFNADGEVSVGGADVDLISFNVPESGGLVSIETSATDSGEPLDTVLRLFDSSGNEISIDDDGGEGLFSRVEDILSGGTYYVGISGYNNNDYNPNVVNSGVAGRTGDYSLGFQFQAGAGDSTEGGDRNGTIATAVVFPDLVFDQAKAVETPGAIIGSDPVPDVSDRVSIGRTDVDILTFEVTTPGFMSIETSDGDPEDPNSFEERETLDSYLRLFDAEGIQIAFDDDSGDGLFSAIETNLSVGTYYLGVSGYGNSNYDPNSLEGRTDGSTGSVDLSFDFQIADNTDPNGVRNGAFELDLVSGEVVSINGEIGTDLGDVEVNEADVDLMGFTATQDATLLIDTDTPFGEVFDNDTDDRSFADTYLRFFDSEGVEIASSDDNFAEDITGEIIEFDTNPEGNSGDPTENSSGNLIGHDVDSFLRVNVTAGETYYVGVSAFGNDSYSIDNLEDRSSSDTGGFYQLSITNITSPDTDGSISQAPILTQSDETSNVRLEGNIGFDGSLEIGNSDIDIYEYIPTQRGLLQLDIEAFGVLENDVDSMLFLYDRFGNELAFNDDESSETFDARLEYLVNAGETYYVAVAGYGNGDFDINVTGSGEAGDTGDYVLDIDLLESQIADSSTIDNPFAANFASFVGESSNSQLDFDSQIVGSAISTLDSSQVNFLTLGETVVSFLGEDPQNSANIFSPYRDLYSQVTSTIFGSGRSGGVNNGGLPDDVDHFPISIPEAGRYDLRTLVANTEVGSIGTQTNLRLYNSEQQQVEVVPCGIGLSGVDERLTVNIAEPGTYTVVVLPEGSASDNFDFATHSFGELSAAEREEFSNSLGEYAFSADRFVLQPAAAPFFYNGALRLQLNDCLVPEEINSSSVTVTDSEGNAIAGSVAVASETGEVTFVPNNPLIAGDYNVTYNSEDFVTQDASFNNQRILDGDGDGNPGGDLIANFSVTGGNVFISTPSFNRTPGQSVNVDGTGLPVSVSNAEGLRDIRIRVDYDPRLLNISNATVSGDLPEDWAVSQININNNSAIIDLAGTTPLSGDTTELIRLNAAVPEDAPLGNNQVLQVSGGQLDNSNNSLIFTETAALHDLSTNDDGNGGDDNGGDDNGGDDNGGDDNGGDDNGGDDNGNDPLNTIELFRFRNTAFDTGTYIFVGAEERDNIQSDPDFNQTFELEGDGNPAFTASREGGDNLIPFYRIRSLDVEGTYLFVSTDEYNTIFAEDSDQQDKWVKEGVEDGVDVAEFYLYDGAANLGTEFNRFQNTQNNTFLYAGPEESQAISDDPNLSNLFINQGTAFKSLS